MRNIAAEQYIALKVKRRLMPGRLPGSSCQTVPVHRGFIPPPVISTVHIVQQVMPGQAVRTIKCECTERRFFPERISEINA
ncbi:Uncharacterised protein [Shigella sonnei]|nr:Uncharacterised protein [Shigella sonnei]